MWIVRRSPGICAPVSKASRHPEVDQERSPALEPDDQILAATLDGFDTFSLEVPRDLLRLERPGQPRVADLDTCEAAAAQDRLETRANRLDLGQLGHRASVARALRPRSRARSGAPAAPRPRSR